MDRINFSTFVKDVAKYTGYSQKNIKEVLEAAEAVMIENLKKGSNVKILPTVNIIVKQRDAYQGINPRTCEPIQIPASKTIKAKFSTSLKEVVND